MNVGDILTFEYSGSEEMVILPSGRYKLEVWGAQGGSGANATYGKGGKGARAYGEVQISPDRKKETAVYINVGGQGSCGSLVEGGYNGGGKSGYNASYATSGGGATHISFQNGLLSAVDPIIAAGGGGGGCYYSGSYYGTGGYGGGTQGGNGYNQYRSSDAVSYGNGQGATQSAGGAAGSYSYAGYAGIKGKGGDGSETSNSYNCSCGGGGGYYGGGGSGWYSSTYYYRGFSGAGGGSSYIDGLTSAGTENNSREGNGFATIECLELYRFEPDPVTNLKQITKTQKQISIAWTASEIATSYNIYRDNVYYANTYKTNFSDIFTEYNESYTYSVTAVNDKGESDKVSIYCETETYFDINWLITDRSNSDIMYLKYLISKGSNLTEEERAIFNTPLKAAYNYSDMNRVGLAEKYIVEELKKIGEIISIDVKTNWNRNNIPSKSDIDIYLATLKKIRNIIKIDVTNIPNNIYNINDANAIEQMLKDMDDIIKRQIAFLYYTGEVYLKEV